MTTLRVLVLGGDNFVARPVLAALEAAAWAAPEPLSSVTDPATLARALARADAVVNCTLGAPALIFASAGALYSAARKLEAGPRIVHLGSMTVYGSATGVVDEDTALRSDLGAYSVAQAAADELAAAYPRTVRLRPGCEYGPGCWQWSQRVARWLVARRLGDLGPAGEGCCNLLYIDDLVAAILAALRQPGVEGQAFNLGIASPPTWNEYFQRYAAALGVSSLPEISAARLMIETRLLAPLLKAAEIVARKAGFRQDALSPAIPPSLLGLCRQNIRLNLGKAEALLGLRWTPLEAGLNKSAAVFHAEAGKP